MDSWSIEDDDCRFWFLLPSSAARCSLSFGEDKGGSPKDVAVATAPGKRITSDARNDVRLTLIGFEREEVAKTAFLLAKGECGRRWRV
jgi:hypothetical protein